MAAVVLGRPAVPALDKPGEDEFAGGLLLHDDRLRSAQPDGKSRKEEDGYQMKKKDHHHHRLPYLHHNSFLPSPAEGSPASSTELDLRPVDLLQAKHHPPVPRLPLYLVHPDTSVAPSPSSAGGRSGVLSSASSSSSSSSSSLSSSSVSSLPSSQLATPKQMKHADERWPSSTRWQDDDDGARMKLEADASLEIKAKASLYDSPLWQRYGWIAVHLAMMLCQACFAAVNVFGKYGMYHVDPIIIIVFRNMGTVPFLLAGVLLVERSEMRKCITWPNILKLSALGVITMLVSQSLYAYGLKYTTATNSATLHLAIPIWTCVICLVMGTESFSLIKILGIACAIGGSLVMTEVESFDFSDKVMFGNFLVFLMTFLYSGYLVFCKPLVSSLPPLNVSMWIFITASIASVPLIAIFWEEFSAAMQITDTKVWASIALAVVVGTAIPYLIITWAIQQASSVVAAIYTPMELIATFICAIIFLGEEPGLRQLLGALFIILGLAVTIYAQQREKKPTIVVEEDLELSKAASDSKSSKPLSELTPLLARSA